MPKLQDEEEKHTPWEDAVEEVGEKILLSFGKASRTINLWKEDLPKGGVPEYIMRRAQRRKKLEEAKSPMSRHLHLLPSGTVDPKPGGGAHVFA